MPPASTVPCIFHHFCVIHTTYVSDFAALVLSLPTRNSTLRMRLWRALKQTGCGVLRDGVYLLPSKAAGHEALARLEAEIRAAGGFAMTLELTARTAAQLVELRKLFDRSALDSIHRKMRRAVQAAGGSIDSIVYCPHLPDDHCDCRKPAPGLLRRLGRRYGCRGLLRALHRRRRHAAQARHAATTSQTMLSPKPDSA